MLFAELRLHYMNDVAVGGGGITAPSLPVRQDVGAGDVICKVGACTH